FFRYFPTTSKYESFDVGVPIGVLALRTAGGLVMATKNGFAFWDPKTQALQFLANPEADKPHTRFNDGAVDSQGRFSAGTMCGLPEIRSARWGGWKITRYDPTGKVEREIQLPVQCPTSCAFSGANLDELYITSAWNELSVEQKKNQPYAGDLFRVKTDTKGRVSPKFAG